MEMNKEVGQRMAYYRKRAGLTQAQLAAKLLVSVSHIGKIECGKLKKGIPLSLLVEICKMLKIQPDDLINLEPLKPCISRRDN